jgi:hypothetical protein
MRTVTFRPRLVGCLLLLGAASALAATAPQAQAPAPAKDLPPELALVPPDTLYFLHLQVDKLEVHPVTLNFLRHLPPEILKDLEKDTSREFGLGFRDFGRITMFMKMTQPLGSDMYAGGILGLRKPVDKARFLKAAVPNAEEKKAGDKVYYATKENARGTKVHFVDEKRVLVLMEMPGENDPKSMERLFTTLFKKKEKGPLTEVIAQAQEKLFVLGVHITDDLRKVFGEFGGLPGEYSWVEPLYQMHVASLTVDLGQVSKVYVQFKFSDANKAKDAEEAAKHGLKFLREQLEGPIAEMQDKATKSKNPKDVCHPAAKLLKELDTTLQNAQVELQETSLKVTFAVKTDDANLQQLAKLLTAMIEKEKKKEKESGNLQRLSFAMNAYHAEVNHLPQPAIYDKNGKPLLSWRVALLPHLGHEELYKQFKLEEPWDSEHNKKLLAKMPDVYQSTVWDKNNPSHTTFKVFVSKKGSAPSSAFVENEAVKLEQILKGDGNANTVLIVEGGEQVPWTKPEDIPFDPQKPLPDLDKHFPHGWHAVFGDNTVRKIKKGAPEKLLKQIITYNGGETEDWSSLIVPEED